MYLPHSHKATFPTPFPFHLAHTHTHTLSLSLSLSLLTSLLSFLPKPTEAISSSLQAMSTSAKPSGAVVRHTNAAVFFQSLFSRISGEVVASCADFLCPPVDGSDKPLFWNVDLDEEQREHMPRWLREGVCVCPCWLVTFIVCIYPPPHTHTILLCSHLPTPPLAHPASLLICFQQRHVCRRRRD